jgi:hypothetical protein
MSTLTTLRRSAATIRQPRHGAAARAWSPGCGHRARCCWIRGGEARQVAIVTTIATAAVSRVAVVSRLRAPG